MFHYLQFKELIFFLLANILILRKIATFHWDNFNAHIEIPSFKEIIFPNIGSKIPVYIEDNGLTNETSQSSLDIMKSKCAKLSFIHKQLSIAIRDNLYSNKKMQLIYLLFK